MAGPAFVSGQQNASSSSGTSVGVSLPSAITAGNMLVAVAATDDANQPPSNGISDNSGGGNVWTLIKAAGNNSNGGCCGVYVCLNAAGGTYTITFTNASSFVAISVAEYTPNGLSGNDGTAGNQAITTGTPDAGNVGPTTNANDVILVVATDNLNNTTWAAGTGYNLRGNVTSSANTTIALQDQTVSATGTYATAYGNTATGGWSCAAAAIKGPATTAGVPASIGLNVLAMTHGFGFGGP